MDHKIYNKTHFNSFYGKEWGKGKGGSKQACLKEIWWREWVEQVCLCLLLKVVQGMQIDCVAMLCMHIDYVGRKAQEWLVILPKC